MKKYVIIGNGAAAVGCIEGIRSVDKSGEITVISKENEHVYSRPLISYYLENKTDLEKIKLRPDDFYKNNSVKVLYNKEAVKINNDKKEVLLSDDKTVDFDELCVCTGSSPFVPKVKGMETVKNSFTFLTLSDAKKIEKAININSRVLIVGAGLIGLKCAEGILERAKSILVCDLATRVLSSILDDESAKIIQTKLEEKGLEFSLGNSVSEYKGHKAVMQNGETVEFDILITAVGVRPNVSLIKDIGGEVNRGIVVNNKNQTSLKNIYSAGDCTETIDFSSKTSKIMALMPNAYIGGKTAGINMAGKEEVFDNPIPMNSIGFFGLYAMSAGDRNEETADNIYTEKGKENIKKLYFKNNRLVGFLLIGNVKNAGIYTNILRNNIDINEVDLPVLEKEPSLFAFSKNYRRKILGGVV